MKLWNQTWENRCFSYEVDLVSANVNTYNTVVYIYIRTHIHIIYIYYIIYFVLLSSK